MMAEYLTLVEPAKLDLIAWFEKARYGDKCHVVAQDRQTYMYLTKISPTTVQWQTPIALSQGPGMTRSVKFIEFLQTWAELTENS
jgi:hypothetical protein